MNWKVFKSDLISHIVIATAAFAAGMVFNYSNPVVIKEYTTPPQETHLHFKGTTYNAIYTEKGMFDVELRKAKVTGVKVKTKDDVWIKQGG